MRAKTAAGLRWQNKPAAERRDKAVASIGSAKRPTACRVRHEPHNVRLERKRLSAPPAGHRRLQHVDDAERRVGSVEHHEHRRFVQAW